MSAPAAVRPHGRAKYVAERCRCDVCRAANAAYGRNRTRQRAYGRTAYIDAAPARAHVQALGAAGMGWKRVASAAGLSPSTVSQLLYGRPGRSTGPTKQLRPAVAEKILGVTLDIAPHTKVDATGTRRRLQALVTIGWSQSRLAAFLGLSPSNFGKLITAAQVYASSARAVSELYERLWDTRPPTATSWERAAAARAMIYARKRAWLPPMAWDDDEIDTPETVR